MVGNFGIFEGERKIGELEVRQDGGYLRFRACCRTECRGVLRLTAETEEGRTVPLGVLVPNGSAWVLDRRFSPAALRDMGLSGIRRCRVMGQEGWYPEPRPQCLVSDPLLQTELRCCTSALTKQENGRTLLALPLETPFHPMSAFCLAEPRVMEGRTWLVFHILSGKLQLPPGHTESGAPCSER